MALSRLVGTLIVAGVALAQSSHAATFTVTHVNSTAAQATAIEHAAEIWGGILESAVPIKVRVTFFPLGANALGITFPNGRRDFSGAPLPQTWYATALANSITGTELNTGESDIDIFLNITASWYTGTDGNPGAGEYDLVSVALHELGHGLGFVGLSKKMGNQGSLGTLQASDFAPLTTSFPWPQLDTLPGIFDRYLNDLQDGPLTMMANPGTVLGSAMTGHQIYFNGPLVMAANAGNAPRIYAPTTYALGSSCVHLNEATYPVGNPNELMTPFSSPGAANHWPGPLCIAMMQDIGWTLAPGVGFAENVETTEALQIWPIPTEDLLNINFGGGTRNGSGTITDAGGRVVLAFPRCGPISVAALEPGAYFVRLDETRVHARFIKQ
ncbi:MAG: hypothetical protein IT229_07765 [Flavobacteriales bacterium]|nr:hypothetical protein [Flavobacteriales bacterium]